MEKDLFEALRKGQYEYVKEHINIHNVNESYNNGTYNALSIAIHSNDYKTIKHLLDVGAFPNFADDFKRTILMNFVTIDKPKIEILKILIEHGANVYDKDRAGSTALFKACLNRYISLNLVKYLIESGSDLSDMYFEYDMEPSYRGIRQIIQDYGSKINSDIKEHITYLCSL